MRKHIFRVPATSAPVASAMHATRKNSATLLVDASGKMVSATIVAIWTTAKVAKARARVQVLNLPISLRSAIGTVLLASVLAVATRLSATNVTMIPYAKVCKVVHGTAV